MYECPSCGSDMIFDVEKQKLFCTHCNKELTVDEYTNIRTATEREVTDEKDSTIKLKVYTCSQCGAQIMSDENTVATFCSYCGNHQMLESRISDEKRPDKIIPFKITKEEAIENYKKVIKSNPFIPSLYKNESEIEKIRGIYMPYDILEYKQSKHLVVPAEIYKRKNSYLYIHKFDIHSEIEFKYEVCGHETASKFRDDLSEAIAPFHTEDAVDFKEGYLTGFYADKADISGSMYEEDYKEEIYYDIGHSIYKSDEKYKEYIVDSRKVGQAALESSEYKGHFALFPVWFLSFKTKSGRISYAVVNGETGKTYAELPVSRKKYLLVTFFISILIFLILYGIRYFNINFYVNNYAMLITSIVLSIICMIITYKFARKIYIKKNRFDDPGILKSEGKEIPYKKGKKVSIIKIISILIFIGITLPLEIFYVYLMTLKENFLNDINYFIFGMICTITMYFLANFSVIKIILEYNNDSSDNKKIKIPLMVKVKSILLPMISLIISFNILMSNTTNFMIYYAGAIANIVLMLISLVSTIKNYNSFQIRELSQLNPRGGDK